MRASTRNGDTVRVVARRAPLETDGCSDSLRPNELIGRIVAGPRSASQDATMVWLFTPEQRTVMRLAVATRLTTPRENSTRAPRRICGGA